MLDPSLVLVRERLIHGDAVQEGRAARADRHGLATSVVPTEVEVGSVRELGMGRKGIYLRYERGLRGRETECVSPEGGDSSRVVAARKESARPRPEK